MLFAVIVSQGAFQIYPNPKGLSMIRVFAAALILGLIVLVGLSLQPLRLFLAR